MPVAQAELDTMQARYKSAVDNWIAAIRAEEALATPAEHSEAQIDQWEAAGFNEEKARNEAREAKSAYEGALREEFFSF